MVRLTLTQVEDLYHQGRVNQVRYEAYALLHSALSPYTRVTEVLSDDPEVVKFARLLRAEHELRIEGKV